MNDIMYYSAAYRSPVGLLTLVSDGDRLAGLWIEKQKHFGGAVLSMASPREDLPVFVLTKKWLDRYFAGLKPNPYTLPLILVGSDFRRLVWGILRAVPYGSATTYGDIAKKIIMRTNAKRMSAQSVGGALARNPISIIVPCHRVLGSDGSLTGYAAGLDVKAKLLELEGVKTRAATENY